MISGVAGVIATLGSQIIGLFGKSTLDKDKQAELQLQAQKLILEAQAQADQVVLKQLEVNKVEAAHASVFVSGWRPATGWLCAIAVVAPILLPYVGWLCSIFGYDLPPPPEVPTELAATALFGMLGLAGARSYDKSRGTARGAIASQK